MAKKRKSNYSVDIYDLGYPDEWRHFKTLKKAARFATRHELTADRIVDFNGDPVPDLDLNDPQWWNHQRLETEHRHQAEAHVRARTALAKEQDAYRNRQVTMIRAGYVPIEIISARLLDVLVEHKGIGNTTVTFTLDGRPGEASSEYKQAPFAALLAALNARISKS